MLHSTGGVVFYALFLLFALHVAGTTLFGGGPRVRGHWPRTEGTVTGVEVVPGDADSATTFAPVLTYTDHHGRAHTFTSPTSTSTSPTVGERLLVAYDPARASTAAVARGRYAWGRFVVAGVALLLAAVATLLAHLTW